MISLSAQERGEKHHPRGGVDVAFSLDMAETQFEKRSSQSTTIKLMKIFSLPKKCRSSISLFPSQTFDPHTQNLMFDFAPAG